MNIIFDYSKLKDLIETTQYFDTKDNKVKTYNKTTFAKAIGLSYYSLYKKLRNIVPFTQNEIIKTVKILNISQNEIPIYFFTEKVKKTQF